MKRNESESTAREKIVETAMRLFNERGVHHTGNEQIIAESGISKMTFYKYFPTKSKLIAEYLRLRDQRWFALLHRHISQHQQPQEKLLSIFEALAEWFDEPDFYGCPFIRGLSDFDDTDDAEVRTCVATHFNETGGLILSLLKELKVKSPEGLTSQLLSLVAGSIVVAHATKSPAAALVNQETAKALLQSAPKEA